MTVRITVESRGGKAEAKTWRLKIDIFPAPTVKMWWNRSLGLVQVLQFCKLTMKRVQK